MAYTQTDIDNLKQAISKGVLVTRHGDTTVTFRSLKEMRETLAMMEREVSVAAGETPRRQVRFKTTKGL